MTGATKVTQYGGTYFTRIQNPAVLTLCPREVMREFRDASDIRDGHADEPQQLWFSVLERFIEDLAISSQCSIDENDLYSNTAALRLARLDFTIGNLGWLEGIGLNAPYVRRVLKKYGYMPELKYRSVSYARVMAWRLSDRLELEYLLSKAQKRAAAAEQRRKISAATKAYRIAKKTNQTEKGKMYVV